MGIRTVLAFVCLFTASAALAQDNPVSRLSAEQRLELQDDLYEALAENGIEGYVLDWIDLSPGKPRAQACHIVWCTAPSTCVEDCQELPE